MTIAELLRQPEWDQPLFKRLASNDTGAAPGHQGGVLIPKELRPYFPGLIGTPSSTTPTLDHRIWADLYDGEAFLERVRTRYQIQTWGGTRKPESRLTDNLTSLRRLARGGDVLIIQRSLLELELYRLILVRRKHFEFQAVLTPTGRTHWGIVGVGHPMSEADYEQAEQREQATETAAFQMFEANAMKTVSRATRIARSVAFRQTVTALYDGLCSVCGTALAVPDGPSELQAAHIVPRAVAGADDARNGLALCRRHHWAFDYGLFGIDVACRIVVPRSVSADPRNKPLAALAGSRLRPANRPALAPAAQALDWHAKNVLLS